MNDTSRQMWNLGAAMSRAIAETHAAVPRELGGTMVYLLWSADVVLSVCGTYQGAEAKRDALSPAGIHRDIRIEARVVQP